MQNSKRIIYFFAFIKFIIPFVLIHPTFELHRDEYLYLADAEHLSWGFLEMPPMLAFMGAISKLFGSGFYPVYFWGGLIGALTMIVVGKIAMTLKGDITAVYIACIAFLFSGFLRMHILFQPNMLDVFFWTLSAYYIIRWIDTDHKKYLYFTGICFGLGILSKYTIAFFIIAFLAGVLLSKQRTWLLNKHFYFAMLIGIIIPLPNLFWQWQHHFPVLHHMQLLKDQQLQYLSRKQFILDQILFTFPSFYIWMIGLFALFFSKPGRKYIVVGWIYFFVITLLIWQQGKSYYAASIYPVLLAIGAVYFERLLFLLSSPILKKTIQVIVSLLIIVIGIRTLPLAVPFESPEKLEILFAKMNVGKLGVLDWEEKKNNPLPQDYADMLGWKEMAEKTAKAYHQLPDSVQQKTMVYGDNYGDAAALAFYRKQLGLPEIYSDDASFAFWLPEKFNYQYFLFATRSMPDANDTFFYHFKTTEIKDSVTQKYAREYKAKIVLYSFPDDTAKAIAERNIKELKAKYNLHSILK